MYNKYYIETVRIFYSEQTDCPMKLEEPVYSSDHLQWSDETCSLIRSLQVIGSILLITISLFFSAPILAQSIDSFPISTAYLTTDALQQIYIATDEGKIIKLSQNGKTLFEYNNRRLGQVSSIDATNPFNILVYYGDLATILLLDRTLSPLKEINLFELNIFEAQAVGLSNDNHIWIYDPITAQLKKINKEGKILFQSRNLKQVTKSTLNINFLIERNNQLYLNDPIKGVFIFDTFGQLQQHLPITGINQFQLVQEQLVYLKDGLIQQYHLKTKETNTSKNPKLTTATTIHLLPQKIVIGKKNQLLLVSTPK